MKRNISHDLMSFLPPDLCSFQESRESEIRFKSNVSSSVNSDNMIVGELITHLRRQQ